MKVANSPQLVNFLGLPTSAGSSRSATPMKAAVLVPTPAIGRATGGTSST
ncbi:hypothetical protein [Mitsuaria sp. TWR114]|nr:hypothetical protein [Mitsuaria sp. TWR114]